MQRRGHAEIVKFGGDTVVSTQWQLYDSAAIFAGPNTGERLMFFFAVWSTAL